jgi:ppGpp synthetase/RelA/SpoT-type nucleotidyltranferase
MQGKWKDKTLDQVTDGIGMRMVFKTQKEADLAVAKFERVSGMKVLEHEDSVVGGKNGGYRAHHIQVRTPGGMIAEVQIKTVNQDKWSRWGHDKIYKAKDSAVRDSKEIQSYAERVSKHLHDQDMGRNPGPRPEAPKAAKDAGLEFPW